MTAGWSDSIFQTIYWQNSILHPTPTGWAHALRIFSKAAKGLSLHTPSVIPVFRMPLILPNPGWNPDVCFNEIKAFFSGTLAVTLKLPPTFCLSTEWFLLLPAMLIGQLYVPRKCRKSSDIFLSSFLMKQPIVWCCIIQCISVGTSPFPHRILFHICLYPTGNYKLQKDSMSNTLSQTVDKALLLQGFAIVGTAFLI